MNDEATTTSIKVGPKYREWLGEMAEHYSGEHTGTIRAQVELAIDKAYAEFLKQRKGDDNESTTEDSQPT